MWIFNGMIFVAIALFMQSSNVHAQNACTAANVQICAPYTCVQTGSVYSCLCPNAQLAQSAAACGAVVTTQSPIYNVCGTITCPAGATCVATSQNPINYVCVCPNNVLANPDCPTTPVTNNPCSYANPCTNGGTCVLNPLTQSAVCLCPPNTYGPSCSNACRAACDSTWCYNGGYCTNLYGQAYCACPQSYRGRRCELRYSAYNYVYLYHSPYYYYYGKK